MKKWMVFSISLIVNNNLLAMSRATQALKNSGQAARQLPNIIRSAKPTHVPHRTFINKQHVQAAKELGKTTAHKIGQGLIGGALVGGTYGACHWIANEKDKLINQLSTLSNLAKNTYHQFQMMIDKLKQEQTQQTPEQRTITPEEEEEAEISIIQEPLLNPEMTELEKALFSYTTPNYKRAKKLLDNGANPNESGLYGGTTPLGRAIKTNNKKLVEFLLDNGASLSYTINDSGPGNSDAMISGSVSPLALAIINNSSPEILELIINKTPDLSYSGMNKKTPLLLAIETKNYDALNALLEKNMKAALKNSLHSPLYAAARNNDSKAFQLLVDAGVRVSNISKLLNTIRTIPEAEKNAMINYYINADSIDID